MILSNFKIVLDDNSFIPKLDFNVIIDLGTLKFLEVLTETEAITIIGTEFLRQIKNRKLEKVE